MTHRILLAYDGTPPALAATEWVAKTFPDASVTILTVLDPMEGFLDTFGYGSDQYDVWREETETAANELLDEAVSAFGADADVSTATQTGQVPRAIIKYATEHDIDHIVMGSHGRTGVSRVLLGSVAEAVVRRSPSTVTVVR